MSKSSPIETLNSGNTVNLLESLMKNALRNGANAADCLAVTGTALSVSQRLGKREDLERSETCDIGLRVFIDKRQAIVSSTDLSTRALDELVQRALAMAKAVPEDPFCGLADSSLLAENFKDLDLFDEHQCSAEELYERAGMAEDAARIHPGITNSEGGDARWGQNFVTLLNSDGFIGGYKTSSHSTSVAVVAEKNDSMERDYDYSISRHLEDLRDAREIGQRAAERTVKRLNPRKAKTSQVPVVFDPRISGSILGHFAGALSGPMIARGSSFLSKHLGEQIFPKDITIIDDPARIRGLGSKPFDGEGVTNKKTLLAKDGILKSWILDSCSARQLGLETTGHAQRGTTSVPSPSTTNLFLAAGNLSPSALVGCISSGLYVTELIGFGVNQITGDYSRGASGFWIENGEITYPVSEVTIAGNLKHMFMHLTPANDLEFTFATNAPTIRIDGMTVAGA